MDKTIAAIIVTYNRKELLKECLNNMFNQNIVPHKVFVIDNACTDGTTEYLKTQTEYDIQVIYMKENLGGAGGFYTGIKEAYKHGYDLFWLMDDDTMCTKNSLEELIKEFDELVKCERIGYLCSEVSWIDTTLCKMNIPTVSKDFGVYSDRGVIKVDKATFVSILITREAVQECGLPIKEFFIWADDTEYTQRINKKFNNYLVSKSKVVHKMANNVQANILLDSDRLERHLLAYRNRFYIYKNARFKVFIKYILNVLYTFLKVLFSKDKYKFKKMYIIVKGTLMGLFFNPKIEIF